MSEIKLIFRENMGEYLQKIKESCPNMKVYSHSRLQNFNQCKRGYYYTYVDKKPQKTGIYSLLGTACHSSLENLYDGTDKKLDKSIFDNEFAKAELFGIEFPKSKYDIKGGYKKDIDSFYNVYKKNETDGKFISELGFILKIDDEHYEIGYIDLLILNKDGTCDIRDFKTSSTFDAKHTIEAGRQLVLYKMAIEQLYNIKVNTVAWEMLKYVDVQVGDNKPKIAIRGREWVKKCRSQIKTLMKKEGIDISIIDMYLNKCESENNLDCLPDNIKNKIKANVHIRYYDVTPEVEEEFINYTKNTIKEIENTNTDNKDLWEVNIDKFFCCNLCSFGGTECKYWEYGKED